MWISRPIREEVAVITKALKIDVDFTISGRRAGPYGIEIAVQAEEKYLGSLYPSWYAFESPDQAGLDAFLRTFVPRMGRITIRVMAPAGVTELLRCWNSLLWVVRMCKVIRYKGHLKLVFEEAGHRTWASRRAKLRASLRGILNGRKPYEKADILILMLPLRRLRKVQLEIVLPPSTLNAWWFRGILRLTTAEVSRFWTKACSQCL